MKKQIYLIGLIVGLIIPNFAFAQLQIDTTQAVETLIQKVLIGNDDVKIANVKFQGTKKALGVFSIDTTKNKFAIQKGLILSTGNATSAQGPNKSPGTSDQMLRKGDKDLDQLSGSVTYDAVVIEFDFIPLQNKIAFQYIFASEEYVEFTNSTYNDVFGFFITGPEMEKGKNLAIIPGTADIVSVNSVNQYKNRQYFYDNNIWQISGKRLNENDRGHLSPNLLKTIEFDGLTAVLTAETNVVPFKKYHLKIAISDVTDMVYNSAVFLEGGSFTSLSDTTADERFQLAGKVDVNKVNFEEIFEGKESEIVFEKVENTEKGEEKVNKSTAKVDIPKDVPTSYEAPPLPATEKLTKKVVTTPSATTGNKVAFVKAYPPIRFETSIYDLDEGGSKVLTDLIAFLKENTGLQVYLYGHTDDQGSDEANMKLSQNRVNTVKKYLITKGVAQDRINTAHYGERQPLSENVTEEGRALNRRVEIFVR